MRQYQARLDGRVPDLTGKRMPSVAGRTLSGENLRVPEDIEGRPSLLLITYVPDAQLDAERWRKALAGRAPALPVYQLSPRRGLATSHPGTAPAPGLSSRGSREASDEHRPATDVAGERRDRVVTLYQTGVRLRGAVGDVGAVAHVVLLDAGGVAVWLGRQGFSDRALDELLQAVRTIATPGAALASLSGRESREGPSDQERPSSGLGENDQAAA